MSFPADITSSIKSSHRRLENSDDSWLSVDLVYFPGVEDPLNTEVKLSWKLIDLNEDFMNIKITFDNPLAVSQDEEADFALV